MAPITFSQEDAEGVHHPHCDALVVRAVVARNGLKRMLVDNGSSVNIFIIPRGRIILPVEMGSAPLVAQYFIEFLVVDHRSAYHGVLGRPALKDLWAVTSIHYLCMKFPTEHGIATVRGDQMSSRACYLNSLRKSEPRTVNVILAEVPAEVGTDVEMLDAPKQGHTFEQEEDVIMEEAPEQGHPLDELDPRIIDYEPNATPMEELETFPVNPEDPNQVLRIGKSLSPEAKIEMIRFLKENLDVFAWKHEDMKRRALNPERYEALKDEVSKLDRSGFIREAIYPRWISNPVLVKKSSEKWRVCVDFTNLNKACPKDSFPLPRIDQLVDSTAGHELLSFMDAYSSLQAGEHVSHIDQTFQILRRYNMKLNPLKCTFGVASGQFLGYIVNQRGIEANPAKVAAIIEMSSPQKPKEVQSLNGRIAALSRFISRATDKSLPFFKVLKQGKRFQWTSECQEAFKSLKKHLGESPPLSKPHPDESLLLYLAVSDVAVSAVLTREENGRQLPVYYISKALLPAETRYSDMEKLALALITASRKLRPYFQAHSIQVLTNFPLRQVMQKTDASGRLLKWAIELSEFDLTFRPRHAIKGQALADFMVEFTKAPEMEALMEPAEPPAWKLFVDGSSGEAGAGARIVLESPEGHLLNCAVRFSFGASNNAAEYEALLAGLRLAKEMQVRKLLASSDSQLVVNQVNGDFAAKDDNMRAYLKLVLDIIPHFEKFELTQVPRLENAHADALSKLASSVNSELLNIVPIEHLSKPSTFEGEELLWIEGTPLWMHPIIAYLKEQTLPASRSEARKLRRRAAHFVLQEGTLYKRGFASPLLRCVGGKEATYVLREIHEGICGNHSGGTKCDKCQRFSNVQRQPAQSLSIVTSPWPFAKWGIDFIGPLPKGRGSATFAIVAIDYFTKWVEEEPLARITEANTTKFVWKNVICRFSIPHSIVSDNGRQYFSTPHHPQANGQVEAVNKTIKQPMSGPKDRLTNGHAARPWVTSSLFRPWENQPEIVRDRRKYRSLSPELLPSIIITGRSSLLGEWAWYPTVTLETRNSCQIIGLPGRLR
ncbi:uncharacterized protein LOC111402573 [Olea europaea var. sylvestris]|uniref:uncharacterized protein LOC111402573 n=1 Tax=Olea europaea var. sylvestris TaxID=158386 RepID=UPI000C1CF456|nr:uncharacterized protein LOC111402573 [Olea europaea var. sylvestris]